MLDWASPTRHIARTMLTNRYATAYRYYPLPTHPWAGAGGVAVA
jgi:hypothetical protein